MELLILWSLITPKYTPSAAAKKDKWQNSQIIAKENQSPNDKSLFKVYKPFLRT